MKRPYPCVFFAFSACFLFVCFSLLFIINEPNLLWLLSRRTKNTINHLISVNLHEASFQPASFIKVKVSHAILWIYPYTLEITILFVKDVPEKVCYYVVTTVPSPIILPVWLHLWKSNRLNCGCALIVCRKWRIVCIFNFLIITGLCKSQNKRSDSKLVHKGKYCFWVVFIQRTTTHVFTSGYRGVYSRSGKWNAQIQYNGKKVVMIPASTKSISF